LTFSAKLNSNITNGSLLSLSASPNTTDFGAYSPALFVDGKTNQVDLFMDRATDTRTRCKSLKSLRAGKWHFFQVVLVGNNSMHSRSVHNQMVEPGATALFIDGQFACQCGAGQPSPESGQPLTAYAGAGHHAGVSTNATVKEVFYGGAPSNLIIGIVEVLRGFLCVVLLWPLRKLTGFRRAFLLRGSVFMGLLACSLFIFSPWLKTPSTTISMVLASLIALLIYLLLLSSPLMKMMADNVQLVARYKAAARFRLSSAAAMTCAPLIQLFALVRRTGDCQNYWNLHNTWILTSTGWVWLPIVAFTTWVIGSKDMRGPTVMPEERGLNCHWLNQNLCCGCTRRFIIPMMCELFLVLRLAADGLTVRFLLLYFVEERNFSPADLCCLICVSRLLTTIFSYCFCLIAKPVGRANAAVLLHLSSCGALWLLADTSSTLMACVFYVLRLATCHAAEPIISSIAFDTVAPSRRWYWSQFSSMRICAFSLSTLAGSFVVDQYGFAVSFKLTCAMLVASVPPFLLVVCLFPRREGVGHLVVPTKEENSVSAMSVSEEARDEPLYQRSVVSGRFFRGAAMA